MTSVPVKSQCFLFSRSSILNYSSKAPCFKIGWLSPVKVLSFEVQIPFRIKKSKGTCLKSRWLPFFKTIRSPGTIELFETCLKKYFFVYASKHFKVTAKSSFPISWSFFQFFFIINKLKILENKVKIIITNKKNT